MLCLQRTSGVLLHYPSASSLMVHTGLGACSMPSMSLDFALS